MKHQRLRSTALPMAYAHLIPKLREVALEHGYAIAVHGSMCSDLDVVAIPWVAQARPAEEVAEAIRLAVGGVFSRDLASFPKSGWAKDPEQKAHGRIAWSIYFSKRAKFGEDPYLDLSVMPRAVNP